MIQHDNWTDWLWVVSFSDHSKNSIFAHFTMTNTTEGTLKAFIPIIPWHHAQSSKTSNYLFTELTFFMRMNKFYNWPPFRLVAKFHLNVQLWLYWCSFASLSFAFKRWYSKLTIERTDWAVSISDRSKTPIEFCRFHDDSHNQRHSFPIISGEYHHSSKTQTICSLN